MQERAPLVEGLLNHIKENYTGFHVPGHQGGEGVDGIMKKLLEEPFKADLTELPGLDSLSAPRDIIKEAQETAAQLFEAGETFFMVNGTTGGLLTMINAVCRPGEKLVVPRQVHQGVFGGIITSGAVPVYLSSRDMSPQQQRIYNVTAGEIEEVLEKHPDARALLLNNPTYYGVCADLPEIRELTAKRGVMLLLDEAHGGHLAFHPDFPPGAAEADADIWVQSTHKTLGSLTQSSMLHIKKGRVDRERLVNMINIFQSTSPSYILLASLDAARRNLALKGREAFGKVMAMAQKARNVLESLGFVLLPHQQGEFGLDITKLALFTLNFKETGEEIADKLRKNYKIQVELYDHNHLILYLTLGHQERDLEILLRAFQDLAGTLHPADTHQKNLDFNSKAALPPIPPSVLTPREAVNLPVEKVPLCWAAGRVSAQTLNLYPPGIPLLVPGELILPEIIDYFPEKGGVDKEGISPSYEINVVRE